MRLIVHLCLSIVHYILIVINSWHGDTKKRSTDRVLLKKQERLYRWVRVMKRSAAVKLGKEDFVKETENNPAKLAPTALAAMLTTILLAGCSDSTSPSGGLVLPQLATPIFTPSPAGTSEYQRHIDASAANAGAEFAGEQRKQWCWSVENDGPPPDFSDRSLVPITKLFDNLYFAGHAWVAQFVLKTPTGYFLLDALGTVGDAENVTVPALTSVGIDPATIKGVMPTHGHGDHFAGVKYLQDTYGTPIYVGSGDAANMQPGANRYPFGDDPLNLTELDSDNKEPQILEIDGLPLTLLSTPGHTAGTFSGILPAELDGESYKLVFWGGTGTPGTLDMAKEYLDGAERLYALAESEKVDGTIHTHPFVDGTLAKVLEINSGGADISDPTSNPFLLGNASTLRSLSVLRECSAAKIAKLAEADGVTEVSPLWLTTTTEAVASAELNSDGLESTVSTMVRVSDPYGTIATGTVTMSLSDNSADSCTADVGDDGVASCDFLTSQSTQENAVTVTYNGHAGSDSVYLSSNTTALLD